jgi:DNA-binding NtrC family response regulator
MSAAPATRAEGDRRVLLVCRSAGRRALLARLVGSAETHASAVEAVLAVLRRRPQAVILNLEDIEGRERDLLAALRRSRPETPVYVIAQPEDEPLARGLVRDGAADYFVLPTDIYRLPRTLEKAALAGLRPGEAR